MSIRKAVLGIALLVGVAVACRVLPAHAEELPALEPRSADPEVAVDHGAEVPPQRRWYGWQVLGSDALAGGLTVACLKLDGGIPCTLPFVLGGSIVHAVHDNYGRAALSLAAHVALPSLGIIVGGNATRATGPCTYTTHQIDGGTETTGSCPTTYGSGPSVGALIGFVAAAAIDAALAYEDAPPPRVVRRSPAVLPTMAVGQSEAVVGLQGRF